MLTAAEWADIDGDKKSELLIAGDWMSPSVFKYINGRLQNITATTGLQTHTGWWSSITTGDFDADGDIDFACGNWGLNSIWKATEAEPLTLLVNDFDGNGSTDPVLCYYLEGQQGTFARRDLLCKTMPKFFNKFHTYRSYVDCKTEDLFSKEAYHSAQKLKCTELRSFVFLNDGHGHFAGAALPNVCNAAPIQQLVSRDIDGDGHLDLLCLGNTNQNYYEQGDIDGFGGVLLKGNGKGGFAPVAYRNCGLDIAYFVRSTALIHRAGQPHLLIGCNSSRLLLYGLKH
ncbi:MAG: VCBS repeat-containing protein [Saprospiraceae bacterium]|nr:VCBS repeat-containing protein [Saprospiraceae bacterium]